MHGVLPILMLMVMLMLTGCSNDDDYRAPDIPTSHSPVPIIPDKLAPYYPTIPYDFSFYYNETWGDVYKIQEHTKGNNGFPVVIMADGYSLNDIQNGEFVKAVSNAVKALTMQKPMKDLVEYLDIYSVVVVSEHSGIDYTEHNTAFKTYFESKSNTNVIGDTAKISGFTYNSLRKSNERMHNALTIMLLNSADYAGVTLMALDTTVVDTIPQGWSLSYIPAYATVSNGDNVFNELIMHEAVGHGIGKLGDEYWYNTKPTQEEINSYKNDRRFGFSTNIKYFAEEDYTKFTPIYYIYKADKEEKYYIHRTVDPEEDIFVPFANDSRYASEGCFWIQGGYTFITLTTDKCGEEYEYIDEKGDIKKVDPFRCKANFYRSSNLSMMGDVVGYVDLEFNILSRLAIYKRINKVANGAGWKYDFETFAKFDKGESTTKSANTFKKPSTTRQRIMNGTEKQLTRPKIILQ